MSSADQLGFSFRPADRRIWAVRDLVTSVRTHVEHEYSDAWVEGEISNFRAHDSGHLYFTLKDQNSQIRAVMFRSQARLLRFRPEDGMHVVLRGRVTVFEGRGELQLSAEYLAPPPSQRQHSHLSGAGTGRKRCCRRQQRREVFQSRKKC